MRLRLVVLSPGKMEGKSISVAVPKFLIGRDPQCQLRPSSPLVSHRHCVLLLRDGKAFIQDLKSTNGTFVNDKQVENEQELKDQDRLVIGTLSLGIRIEAPVPATERITQPTKNVEDEAATLLLSLADDDTTKARSEAPTESEIAAGTTVLGIPAPADPATAEDKPAPTKMEQAKQAQADTSSAASAILSKYMRRR